jgi:glycosyltransferase involved in cell wall biosynthesis
MDISVVIITKNEQANISGCIRSAMLLCNDVVVVDSGSTDRTIEIAKAEGAIVIKTTWKGYGYSRNLGAEAAINDWIFALDADERITPELVASIATLDTKNIHCIYGFRRDNFFFGERIRFGTLGFEKSYRFYNRTVAKWNSFPVHEKIISDTAKQVYTHGHFVHYGIRDLASWRLKKKHYARLGATKYFEQNKKASLLKRFGAPVFNACKSYVFQLGFLDGKKGWIIAKVILSYSWLKYKYLHRLEKEKTSSPLRVIPSLEKSIPSIKPQTSVELKRGLGFIPEQARSV